MRLAYSILGTQKTGKKTPTGTNKTKGAHSLYFDFVVAAGAAILPDIDTLPDHRHGGKEGYYYVNHQ